MCYSQQLCLVVCVLCQNSEPYVGHLIVQTTCDHGPALPSVPAVLPATRQEVRRKVPVNAVCASHTASMEELMLSCVSLLDIVERNHACMQLLNIDTKQEAMQQRHGGQKQCCKRTQDDADSDDVTAP